MRVLAVVQVALVLSSLFGAMPVLAADVAVPAFAGQTGSQYANTLASAGLVSAYDATANDPSAAVTSVSPAVGTVVPGGSTVTISTSAPATPPPPTPEPTASPTDAPTATPTDTPAPTPSPTDTPAPTPSPTDTPGPTASPTDTPAPTTAPTPTPLPAAPVSYIVTFAASTTAAERSAAITAAGGVTGDAIPALNLQVATFAASAAAAGFGRLAVDPSVVHVDADATRAAGAEPSDPRYADQWSLPKIGWDQVYGSVSPSGSATVAVLDTGVDAAHPDLSGQLVPGLSVLAGGQWWSDPNGHGTAMAGIVAALTDNGEGIAGLAYARVRVMPITVLGTDGTGQDSDIIAGVVAATDLGADVILMAFSNPGYSSSLQAAVDYAWAHGAVVVAATGNDGASTTTFPAGDRGVIGVSNTTQDDTLNDSSNHGADTFLGAPGTDIPTLGAGGGTLTVTGTSASAAAVAAAAALVRANDPGVPNGVVVNRLAESADAAGTADQTGNGRLNLARAMSDTSTASIQPAGAAPVGGGGPLVGPYVAGLACTAAASGSWSATSGVWTGCNGGGASPPAAGDSVTVAANVTLTVDVDTASVAAMTLAAPATNGQTTKVTVGSGKSLNVNSGTANLTISGATAGNTRMVQLDVAAGTVNVTGNVVSNNSMNSITFTTGTLNVGGSLGTPAGFTAGTGTVNLNGTGATSVPALNYNNLGISGARTTNSVTLPNSGTVGIAGSFTPTATFTTGGYVVTGSTVDFNGATQSIPAFTFNNLNASGTLTKTLVGNVPVNGNLGVNAGTLDLSTFTANRSASGGTFTLATGTTLRLAGTFPANYTTNTLNAASTVEYYGTAAQTVASVNYGNLTVSGSRGSNSITLAGTGTIGVASVFNPAATFGGGGYLVTGSTVTFNGAPGQAVPAFNYFNLSTTGNTARTLANSGTVGVAGAFTPTGTITVTGSTVDYNGGGPQTITAFNYNNLTSSNTGARTVSGTGTVSIAGAFTPGTNTYTVTGSTVNYNGAPGQVVRAFQYFNLSGTNAARVLEAGITQIAGAFTPGTTAYTVTGTTVEFNGSAGQSANAFTFNNLTMNNAAGLTLSGTVTVQGTLNFTLGNITTGANAVAIASGGSVGGAGAGTGFVVGNLRKAIDADGSVSRTFEVGTGTAYSPIDVMIAGVSGSAATGQTLTGSSTAGDRANLNTSAINPLKSVNRYWTLTRSGTWNFISYDGTFHFVNADVDAGANTNNFIVQRWDGSAWSTPTAIVAAANSTTGQGFTGFSDFAVGQPLPASVTLQPSSDTGFSSTDGITNADPLVYGVTFDQPVTGLEDTDFDLTGSTATGCSVGAPAGSGATYTVAVSGCSNGTVVLTLKAESVTGDVDGLIPPNPVSAATVTIERTAPVTATVTTPTDLAVYRAAVSNVVPTPFGGSVADDASGVGLNTNGTTFTLQRPDLTYWTGSVWQGSPFFLAANNTGTTDGSAVTWTSSATLPTWTAQPDGTYTVRGRATDRAGNTFSGTAITFVLDKTAPTGASVTAPVGGSTLRAASVPTFGGSANDNTGGSGLNANSTIFTLQRANNDFWNGATWQVGAFPLATTHAATSSNTPAAWTSAATMPDWSTTADGVYRVQATATDRAGNTFAGTQISFTLDNTAPTVLSIVRASTNPTNAATVNYTVTFSESVSGPSTCGCFSLTTTGSISGASVGSITGTGTQRTVPVNTGTVDGTIRLDMAASATVVDTAGNALVTGFNTGEVYTVDKTAPSTASVTTPANGSVLRTATMPASFSGSVADNTGGVGLLANNTTITIQRSTDGRYWTGSSWVNQVQNLVTTHAATSDGSTVSWSYATLPTGANLVEATYTVQATARDRLTNTFTGAAITFVLDNTNPAAASVTAPANNAVLRTATMPSSFGGSAADNTGGSGLAADSTTFTLQRANNDFWNGSAWQAGSFALATTHSPTAAGATTTWSSSATLPNWASEADGVYRVHATATDRAGNTFSGTQISFTLDNTAPAVFSINRAAGAQNPTNAPTVDFTVTFTESVSGPCTNTGDFTVTQVSGTFSVAPSISACTGSGATRTVTVDTGTGDGVIRLDQTATTGITDTAGNPLTGTFNTGQTYTIDKTQPTVEINQRLEAPPSDWYPPAQDDPTSVQPIHFAAVFSEPINPATFTGADLLFRADAGDATFFPSPSVVITQIGPLDGTTFDLAVSNLSTGRIVKPSIPAGGVADLAGNLNTASTSTLDDEVTFTDTAPPLIASITRDDPSPTKADPLHWTATFSEPVDGVASDGSDFTLTNANLSGSAPAITSALPIGPTPTKTWTVTVATTGTTSISNAGSIRLDLSSAGSIADAASNPLSTANLPFAGEAYTFDTFGPDVVSINRSTPAGQRTNVASVTFTVTFNESVTGGDPLNFTATVVNGTLSGVSVTSVTGSGTTRSVTVNTGSGDGELRLDLTNPSAAGGIADTLGNAMTSTFTTGQTYIIDRTPPPVAINQGAAQTDPTTGTTINFAIVFEDPVTGFTAAGTTVTFECTTAGTCGTPGKVLTGSGTTYNLAVTGMTNNANVKASVDADAATDLAGNQNAASTTLDSAGQCLGVNPYACVFFDAQNASISGILYQDFNADGSVNLGGGEAVVLAQTVVCARPISDLFAGNCRTSGGTQDQFRTTTSVGTPWAWTISGLPQGTYRIYYTLPTGWRDTGVYDAVPRTAYSSNPAVRAEEVADNQCGVRGFSVAIAAGETTPPGYSVFLPPSPDPENPVPWIAYKLCMVQSNATVTGKLWNDANGNGSVDLGETGLGGSNFVICSDMNGNGVCDPDEPQVSPTGSGGNTGNYSLGGLVAGPYVNHLIVQAPSMWVSTQIGGLPVDVTIPTAGGTVSGQDFFLATQFISGKAVNDQNANGQDDSDPPLGGAVVKLYNATFLGGVWTKGTQVLCGGNPCQVTTTGTGKTAGLWSFSNLSSGFYIVEKTNPANFGSTGHIGGTGLGSSVVMNATECQNPDWLCVNLGTFVSNNEFLAAQNNASITGGVYNDLNGNGKLDGGAHGTDYLIGGGSTQVKLFRDAVNLGNLDDPGDTLLSTLTITGDTSPLTNLPNEGVWNFPTLFTGTYFVQLVSGPSTSWLSTGAVAANCGGQCSVTKLSNTLLRVVLPAGRAASGSAFLLQTQDMEIAKNPTADAAGGPCPRDSNDATLVPTVQSRSFLAGQVVDYTIRIANCGAGPATGITVSDPIPAHVTNATVGTGGNEAADGCKISGNPSTFSCATPGGFVLQQNETRTYHFSVRLPPDYVSTHCAGVVAGCTIVNTATVDSASTIPEDNTDNNTTTTTDTVSAQADIRVVKTDAGAVAGTTMTYTVAVTNLGPSDAPGVNLTDDFTTLLANPYVSNVRACLQALAGQPNCGNEPQYTFTPNATNPRLLTVPIGLIPGPTAGGTTTTRNVLIRVELAAAGGRAGDADNALSNTAVVTRPTCPTVTYANTCDPTQTSGNDNASDGHQNTFTHATTITRQADLGLAKSGLATVDGNPSTTTVVAGNDLTYTLTVHDYGPSNSSGYSISDTLPANVKFKTAGSGPDCSVSGAAGDGFGGTVTCTKTTDTAAGTDSAHTVVVTVRPSVADGGTLFNTATVTGTDPEPATATQSNTGPLTTNVVRRADLSIVKTGLASVDGQDSSDTVVAGTDLTYTITITNNGPSAANLVAVSDSTPTGTTFVSADPGAGGSCPTAPAAGGTGAVACSWTGDTALNGTRTLTLVVHVDPDRADGSSISNTATTSSADVDPNDPESGTDDNSATRNTGVLTRADLTISKTGSATVDGSTSYTQVVAGTDLTYAIMITNTEPSDAQNVAVGDTTPTGTTFVSATPSAGGTCPTKPAVGGTGAVSCSWSGATAPAGTRTLTLVVHVNPDRANGSNISNTASASSATVDPNDPTHGTNNNSATRTTGVVTRADLKVTKTVPAASPYIAGTDITYSITVENLGPSDNAGFTLTDNIPTDTTFVSASSPACVYAAPPTPAKITCTSAGLTAAGATSSVTWSLTVHIASSFTDGGTLSNTAAIATNATTDPVSGNDSSQKDVTVGRLADLSITKTGPGFIVPGDPDGFNYTITVHNGGPSDNAGFTVSDPLPTGFTFVASAPSSPTCTGTTTVTCTWPSGLAARADQTFTLHVLVSQSVEEGISIGNYATVTSTGTTDPDSSNNTNTCSTGCLVFTKFFGLIGLDSVSIGAAKGSVDGVKSDGTQNPPAYPGGKFVDVLSNGPITIGGAAVSGSVRSTHGSITVTGGGKITADATAGTTISAGSGAIGGARNAPVLTRRILAAVTWSPCTPLSATALRAKLTTGTYTYNATTGDISISSSGNIVTFSDGDYCFRNFTLSGNASVRVGGPVRIFASGVLSASGGSLSNTTNIPADLEIFSSYSGASGVTISGGTQSYLTVYAPLTDVTIAGGSPLWGAILGKTIVSTGNAQIHVDLNIPGGASGWAPGLSLGAI